MTGNTSTTGLAPDLQAFYVATIIPEMLYCQRSVLKMDSAALNIIIIKINWLLL